MQHMLQEFLCPFCSSALFHPIKYSKVKSHLERNFKHTVLHEDHHMWPGWAAEFLYGMLGRPSSLVRIIITGVDGLNICCDTEAHLVCPCEGLKHHFSLEFIPAWEDLAVFCL